MVEKVRSNLCLQGTNMQKALKTASPGTASLRAGTRGLKGALPGPGRQPRPLRGQGEGCRGSWRGPSRPASSAPALVTAALGGVAAGPAVHPEVMDSLSGPAHRVRGTYRACLQTSLAAAWGGRTAPVESPYTRQSAQFSDCRSVPL